MTAPMRSPSEMTGAATETQKPLSESVTGTQAPPLSWRKTRRDSIICSSSGEIRFSKSSLLPPPATAITASLSQTAAMQSVDLCSESQICAAKSESSPMGEYFLKMTSPSLSVKISSGSPSLTILARRTLSA